MDHGEGERRERGTHGSLAGFAGFRDRVGTNRRGRVSPELDAHETFGHRGSQALGIPSARGLWLSPALDELDHTTPSRLDTALAENDP